MVVISWDCVHIRYCIELNNFLSLYLLYIFTIRNIIYLIKVATHLNFNIVQSGTIIFIMRNVLSRLLIKKLKHKQILTIFVGAQIFTKKNIINKNAFVWLLISCIQKSAIYQKLQSFIKINHLINKKLLLFSLYLF